MYTVVGIVPDLPIPYLPHSKPQLWVPWATGLELWGQLSPRGEQLGRDTRFLEVIARLKPGISLRQAQAEMDGVARRLAEGYPEGNTGWGVSLVPLHEQVTGNVRQALLILFGAVGFVLLIACANVANLLLARTAARRREIAVRTALGAGRLRVIRQLLTESILLGLLGGGLGLLLGLWGTDVLVALSPRNLPRVQEVGLDGRVLGFTLAVSLLTGMVFGLTPALEVSKTDLNKALKEGGGRSNGGSRRHRLGKALLVSEVALSLVLLIGAMLLIKSFLRLRSVDPGFDPKNLLTMGVSLPEAKYHEAHQRAAFFQRVLERIENLPGVRSIGGTLVLPFSGNNWTTYFTVEGHPPPARSEDQAANFRVITPHYFRAMGIPLRKGRLFTDRDVPSSPRVAIINEAFARRYFPGEDPIGKSLSLRDKQGLREVVGVVGDAKHASLHAETRPEVYVPFLQSPYYFLWLVVRTASEPGSLASAIEWEVRAVDKDQAVSDVRTMEELLARSIGQRRFNMLLLLTFAVLALALASVGLYGVMSYSVTQRTHEIGIRMALGAGPRDVLKLVVGQGLVLTLLGVGIGLVAAFGLTRLMSSLLYGVRADDPATFGFVSLLLIAVALLASYIPARKAANVDPTVALRYE